MLLEDMAPEQLALEFEARVKKITAAKETWSMGVSALNFLHDKLYEVFLEMLQRTVIANRSTLSPSLQDNICNFFKRNPKLAFYATCLLTTRVNSYMPSRNIADEHSAWGEIIMRIYGRRIVAPEHQVDLLFSLMQNKKIHTYMFTYAIYIASADYPQYLNHMISFIYPKIGDTYQSLQNICEKNTNRKWDDIFQQVEAVINVHDAMHDNDDIMTFQAETLSMYYRTINEKMPDNAAWNILSAEMVSIQQKAKTYMRSKNIGTSPTLLQLPMHFSWNETLNTIQILATFKMEQHAYFIMFYLWLKIIDQRICGYKIGAIHDDFYTTCIMQSESVLSAELFNKVFPLHYQNIVCQQINNSIAKLSAADYQNISKCTALKEAIDSFVRLFGLEAVLSESAVFRENYAVLIQYIAKPTESMVRSMSVLHTSPPDGKSEHSEQQAQRSWLQKFCFC